MPQPYTNFYGVGRNAIVLIPNFSLIRIEIYELSTQRLHRKEIL